MSLTLLDELEDQIILFLRLHRHKVHAVLAAYVAAVQPVDLPVGESWDVPAEEVMVASVEELLWSWSKKQRLSLKPESNSFWKVILLI